MHKQRSETSKVASKKNTQGKLTQNVSTVTDQQSTFKTSVLFQLRYKYEFLGDQ